MKYSNRQFGYAPGKISSPQKPVRSSDPIKMNKYWQKHPIGGNYILYGRDKDVGKFYVSYSPYSHPEETALVIPELNSFCILMGDYREEYQRLVPKGYDACKRYFESIPKSQRSEYSH